MSIPTSSTGASSAGAADLPNAFDNIPSEVIGLINRGLEIEDQAALSKTERRMNAIVKSNLAATKELEYLEKKGIPLDHEISEIGRDATYQDVKDTIFRVHSEAKNLNKAGDFELSESSKENILLKALREVSPKASPHAMHGAYNIILNVVINSVLRRSAEVYISERDLGVLLSFLPDASSDALKSALEATYRAAGPNISTFIFSTIIPRLGPTPAPGALLAAIQNNKHIISSKFRGAISPEVSSEALPTASTDFSKFSYENTIKLHRLYLLELYKIIQDNPVFCTQFTSLFKTDFLPLEGLALDDPTLEYFLTGFLNKVKVFIIKQNLSAIANSFGEEKEMDKDIKEFGEKIDAVNNFDNRVCLQIISRFRDLVKAKYQEKVENLKHPSLQNFMSKVLQSANYWSQDHVGGDQLFHIWKNEVFEPFFNLIPKKEIFNFLTKQFKLQVETGYRERESNILIFATGFKSNSGGYNLQFLKFLLESLDVDDRKKALQVEINDHGTTIVQRILQNIYNFQHLQTILKTVSRDSADMKNYLKENLQTFNLELPKDKEFINWISTILKFDGKFSDLNDQDALFYLKFYKAHANDRTLLKMLNEITEIPRRDVLILKLFEDPSFNFYRNRRLKKDTLFKILNSLSSNSSQASFLKFTNYELIKENDDLKEILKKEILEGNYQHFEGLIKFGSADDLRSLMETENADEVLKPLIIEHFTLSQTPEAVKELLSKLSREEQIHVITKNEITPDQIFSHDLYDFLDTLGILFECLLDTKVRRKSSLLYSLLQAPIILNRNETLGNQTYKERTIAIILRTIISRGKEEAARLLSITPPDKIGKHTDYPLYFTLIKNYPDSERILEEAFPGFDTYIRGLTDRDRTGTKRKR